jgi:ribose transport system ATP-binding protein
VKVEIVRIDRGTTSRRGVTYLDDFNLSVGVGEVVGMVTINQHGMEDLIDLLMGKRSLSEGRLFLKNQLVEGAKSKEEAHYVTIINYDSRLIPGMTVADHLFTLRKGFGVFVVRKRIVEEQSNILLKEYKVATRADKNISELSTLERCQIELVRGVLSGAKLIILQELGKILGEKDLTSFFQLVEEYVKEGVAFLYIGSYPDESFSYCNRWIIYDNGKAVKTYYQDQLNFESLNLFLGQTSFPRSYKMLEENLILQLSEIDYGEVKDFSCSIYSGECVTILDSYSVMLEDLFNLFLQKEKIEKGEFNFLEGEYLDSVLFIPENPVEKLLFHDCSYLYNLTFLLDKKVKKNIIPQRMVKSLLGEWKERVDRYIKLETLDGLSIKECYELMYYRILLYRPKLVVVIQPFIGVDTQLRAQIIQLISLLQKESIGVLVLTSYLAELDEISNKVLEVREREVVRRK